MLVEFRIMDLINNRDNKMQQVLTMQLQISIILITCQAWESTLDHRASQVLCLTYNLVVSLEYSFSNQTWKVSIILVLLHHRWDIMELVIWGKWYLKFKVLKYQIKVKILYWDTQPILTMEHLEIIMKIEYQLSLIWKNLDLNLMSR